MTKMKKGEMLSLWAGLTQNAGDYLSINNVRFQYACKRTMEKLRPEIKILGEVVSPLEEDFEQDGKTLHRVKKECIKEHSDFLNAEIEVDIHTIPQNHLPTELNGFAVSGLFYMISDPVKNEEEDDE